MRTSGRRAKDICIARAALVMLNFELGQEEDIVCAMDLREYLSATPSTSSTATIVTIIYNQKSNVILIDLYFRNFYSVPMNTVRHWLDARDAELKLTL